MLLRAAILLAACSVGSVLGQARSYGALDVDVKQYPFVVGIAFGSDQRGNGAIIAPQWVISTAHTFTEYPDEYYVARVGGSDFSEGDRYRNRRIYKHGDFIGWDADIALMKLTRKLVFSNRVRSINMNLQSVPSANAVMLSYGRNEANSKHLRAARYRLASDRGCASMLDESYSVDVINNGNGYCLIPDSDGPKGQSFNDAGAPLVSNNMLIALFSHGDSKSVLDYNNISVATRISAYGGWIHATMRN